VCAICALTWPPDSESWTKFTPIFTAYFFYLGIVQFISAQYQKNSHYNRVAMGDATKMDVTRSETIAEFHEGLTLVVVRDLSPLARAPLSLSHSHAHDPLVRKSLSRAPFQIACFIAYAMQAYIGVALLKTLSSLDGAPWYEFREQVQCGILGALFLVLGVVNFIETVRTLIEKWLKTLQRKRDREKRDRENFSASGGGGATFAPPNPVMGDGEKKHK
jgi:uncharacterized membrane protein YeiB